MIITKFAFKGCSTTNEKDLENNPRRLKLIRMLMMIYLEVVLQLFEEFLELYALGFVILVNIHYIIMRIIFKKIKSVVLIN